MNAVSGLKERVWRWSGFANSAIPHVKPVLHNSSSLLDAVGKDPQRFKLITDTFFAVTSRVIEVGQSVYRSFTTLGDSFADIFYINVLVEKLKKADAKTLATALAPYLLAGLTEYMSNHVHNLELARKTSIVKFMISCIVLGHSMSQRITEKKEEPPSMVSVVSKAASIWSLYNLHAQSFTTSQAFSDHYLSPLENDELITSDTRESVNLLAGIIGSCAILPKLLLIMCDGINKLKLQQESWLGEATQSSHHAKIPNGSTPEVNFALQCYDHSTTQLKDPSRLFQYGIVILNVLKDVAIPDPLAQVTAKISRRDLFIKKTRNIWLLAVVSFLQAKSDLKSRLQDVTQDREINLQQYTVIRKGACLRDVFRHELLVGDLIKLEDAVKSVEDRVAGTTRTKATLSGYLVQLGNQAVSKKVALNLAELNGESKPVILEPARVAKPVKECRPVDLLTVVRESAILPGAEFLSFDNGNPDATGKDLYVQIAPVYAPRVAIDAREPFSTKQIADLKSKFINGVIAASAVGGLLLMQRHEGSLSASKLLQYYGTEFVNKFTQVFVEAQVVIPLTSEVMLELTNSELVRRLNQRLTNKVTVSSALSVADLFEFIHKKRVRIYSDKTGTVTESTMHLRSIVTNDLERTVLAFATTFSDQKTEAEENEIQRYLEVEKGIEIDSRPISGQVGLLEKTIVKGGNTFQCFTSRHVGFFPEFGGQFTIREGEEIDPVLVFCGVPKIEWESGVLQAYQKYEEQERASVGFSRQDSLTRDWCISEATLTNELHEAFIQALALKNPDDSKKLLKHLLVSLRANFEYLGVFQIDNPIKQGAREAIQRWNSAGIGFMLITGDTKNASRLIAEKLFPFQRESILEKDELAKVEDWKSKDLSRTSLILTDTSQETLALLDDLEALGDKKPNIIFCQMRDVDKKNLVVHAKLQGYFVIANGDGCNDLLMLKEAHVAIGDAARDGSFARDVQESSTFTDIQLRELMQKPNKTLYHLFDLQKGKESRFLKHFAPIANTQPKVICALLIKALKSVAVPRALGYYTTEIPSQFGKLLAYDGAFLAATYQTTLATSHTPLLARPVNESRLPYVALLSAVAMAALESIYCYSLHNRQVTTGGVLLTNLAVSIATLVLSLAPPGFAPVETVEHDEAEVIDLPQRLASVG